MYFGFFFKSKFNGKVTFSPIYFKQKKATHILRAPLLYDNHGEVCLFLHRYIWNTMYFTYSKIQKKRSEYGVKSKIPLAPALKSRTMVKLLLVCKFNPHQKLKNLTKS